MAFAAVLTLTCGMTGVGIWELSRVAEAKEAMKQAALKQTLADKWLEGIATNSVRTVAKAKSNVTAVADGEAVDWQTEGDKIVPVDIHDAEGKKVFTARITMNVKLS